MDDYDDTAGEIFEALTIEKIAVPPLTPPFTGYGSRPEYWDWWGSRWSAHAYKNGEKYTDIEYKNLDGKRHRIYGPAYISKRYDIQEWYKDGERHRVGAPAFIHKNNRVWFCEGKLHNLEGPAVIEGGGPKQYWIEGVRYSKKQYEWEIRRRKRKGLIK